MSRWITVCDGRLESSCDTRAEALDVATYHLNELRCNAQDDGGWLFDPSILVAKVVSRTHEIRSTYREAEQAGDVDDLDELIEAGELTVDEAEGFRQEVLYNYELVDETDNGHRHALRLARLCGQCGVSATESACWRCGGRPIVVPRAVEGTIAASLRHAWGATFDHRLDLRMQRVVELLTAAGAATVDLTWSREGGWFAGDPDAPHHQARGETASMALTGLIERLMQLEAAERP